MIKEFAEFIEILNPTVAIIAAFVGSFVTAWFNRRNDTRQVRVKNYLELVRSSSALAPNTVEAHRVAQERELAAVAALWGDCTEVMDHLSLLKETGDAPRHFPELCVAIARKLHMPTPSKAQLLKPLVCLRK